MNAENAPRSLRFEMQIMHYHLLSCQQDLVLIKNIFNATTMSSLIKSCSRWKQTTPKFVPMLLLCCQNRNIAWKMGQKRNGKRVSKRNGVDNSTTNIRTHSNIEKSIIFELSRRDVNKFILHYIVMCDSNKRVV